MYQDVTQPGQLSVLHKAFKHISADLKLTKLDEARMSQEVDRTEKRFQQQARMKVQQGRESVRDLQSQQFTLHSETLNGFRQSLAELSALDLSQDIQTFAGESVVTDGMRLSQNGLLFQRAFLKAQYPKLNSGQMANHSRALIALSFSTLTQLYDQGKFTDEDLFAGFELILHSLKDVAPSAALTMQKVLQAHPSSRALQLLFSAPLMRKTIGRRVLSGSFYGGYAVRSNPNSDGFYSEKVEEMKTFYRNFIQANQIAPSCRFIYR